MDYRKDSRTDEQFKKDIEDSHAVERNLAERFVKWLCKNSTHKITLIDNGVDNSGKYIPKCKDVNTKSDFLIHHEGSLEPDIPLEIKFCRPDRNQFHFKTGQIKSYIKQKSMLVNWMGIDGDNPEFCIFYHDDLVEMVKNCPVKRMWYKDVYRLYRKDYVWFRE